MDELEKALEYLDLWEKTHMSTSSHINKVSPSSSYMMTGGPPLTPDQEKEREKGEDESTMYFDEETQSFVPYPPYLRQVYDWLQEKGWISSLMDFTEFRDEWYSYIRKNRRELVKRI